MLVSRFRGRSAVPAKRAIGVCRRTGSDNLETCHCEKIHGEKFCRHASDVMEEMKENLRKGDEEERRIVDKGVKLGRTCSRTVKNRLCLVELHFICSLALQIDRSRQVCRQ